ncbi:MAG: tetratricopeptide repeat protein [Bdellovibrionales bacterium]|nr:tetratricopeptide repeat protein [Bdellovibrionales bacterium]
MLNHVSSRAAAFILVLGIGVGAFVHSLQDNFIGKRPTEEYVPQAEAPSPAVYDDPVLNRLREAVAASPKDISGYIALAEALEQRIAKGEIPKQNGSLELVDILSRALEINPDEWKAVLMLADVAFESRVFGKSKELYERYLAQHPNDYETKARYASAISFLGEIDKALSILEDVVQNRPEDFRAHAFLAITYAQKGNLDKSFEVGQAAIQKAPSDEARARFQEFLDSVKERSSLPPSETQPDSQEVTQLSEPAIVQAVRTNPVAGSKFAGFEEHDSILILFFHDFPMQAMPPFAKEKFFAALREKSDGKIKEVHFVDQPSGKVMEKMYL